LLPTGPAILFVPRAPSHAQLNGLFPIQFSKTDEAAAFAFAFVDRVRREALGTSGRRACQQFWCDHFSRRELLHETAHRRARAPHLCTPCTRMLRGKQLRERDAVVAARAHSIAAAAVME
jgi:hypothetical protein